MNIKDLDSKQLKQIISDASSALNWRQKIDKATSELKAVKRKYQLSNDDLRIVFRALEPSKPAPARKVKKARAKVKAKYRSQDGENTWTGRGRNPKWVVETCESKGLTLQAFKSDSRFLIENADSQK